ncbi:E3 ubiquitin ligase BIG BROTHER-related protein [Arabidopsis thaliana]|jgi:E3 ubiquitin-protein ligase BIG BROTHER-like protein|uniref:E3 ubiquitin ligase BIG BROTHER-related n=3 Tax=Arabidopsis TaxID=3701 RepID=BBR_ARATH|nr:RING/U-box superfamily protein [Arabidopsis thaliana]Q9LT17.1 RecName: Full=E3 ubiquitin ligase BIG BROTHER-related; Short=AtBBR; AltName: Full=RING-type E3 ubiquitin transferase BIG BROTHER-related [Arabidopsis thaliana]KAG7625890.1 Zinc finger RING-type [Arabidopsis thaliana x Arabidopsis arenosa]AAK73948.1 AT3g19910/MPN9_15 [Arabidopsis thaliana]AAK76658.1 unknown protein [Arabidopsis thaliana]AAL85084.1 unknown protein [Arabidopsis thaliana]AEE76307.1 RING/U-box superfamily protein [Ar|eukprot:NP_566651.1 RING/U-box superfamily protein [Arabidopsis thaliana]
MPMENDNGPHVGNVVVTAEQATKINETDGRLPENRQTGVVSDTGSGSERGEQGVGESAVAVAVPVEESGSISVGELPAPRSSSARVPFTNLSQIDADLALARTLQEQERAYMMLTMNSEISDYGSWETGSYVYDEDEFDDPENEDEDDDEDEYETDDDPQEDGLDVNVHANEDDQEDDGNSDIEEVAYTDDEAYARALQEAEERDMAARLSALSGLANRVVEDLEDESHTSQDAWDEMDPDELSYEELLALGDIVGTESRGLSADTIASLPSKRYKEGDNQNGTNESCVICRLDYEDDEDLILLPCKHSYHSECINNWLKINKVCPVCSAEVSTSTSGQS